MQEASSLVKFMHTKFMKLNFQTFNKSSQSWNQCQMYIQSSYHFYATCNFWGQSVGASTRISCQFIHTYLLTIHTTAQIHSIQDPNPRCYALILFGCIMMVECKMQIILHSKMQNFKRRTWSVFNEVLQVYFKKKV